MNKIFVFLPNLSGGGVERTLLNLSEYFHTKKYQINLVVGENSGQFSNLVGDIPLINLGAKSAFSSLIPLIKLLRNEKPTYILTGMPHANAVLILASIFSGFKGKIVISVHENPYTIHSNKTFYERCILFLCKYIYRYAHGFIAVSSELSKAYEQRIKYLPLNKIVIPNPILKKINLSRRASVESSQIINIVSAGRLSYEKNFELLINAFSDLPDKAKYSLRIYGEGAYKRQLEDLIVDLKLPKYIQLEGFSNSLANELRKADLFILTSFWEGFGNVLVEALNEGCQVISSDCQSGPREILENGRWGQLFPVNDKDALVNAIIKFKVKPIPLGLSNHLQRYTYEEVGNQYDAFLRKL